MTCTLSGVMCEAQAVETSTNRKRVLVTGASCGIGEAFAHWYAEQGFEVVLAARNLTELTRVAAALQARGAITQVIVADLSNKNGVEDVGAHCGLLDAVVLNAGITHAAAVGSSNLDPLSCLFAREANVLVYNREFARKLRVELLAAIECGGRQIQADEHAQRPRMERLISWLCYKLMLLAVFLGGFGSRY